MAIITSYPNDTDITGNERVVGTNVNTGDGSLTTSNFLMSDIKDYVVSDIPAATTTNPGLLAPTDQVKINHLINLDSNVDLPQLQSDFNGLPAFGTAATSNTGDFASAAQGTLATNAVSRTTTASQSLGGTLDFADGQMFPTSVSSNAQYVRPSSYGTSSADTFAGKATTAGVSDEALRIRNNADTAGDLLTFRRLSESEYQTLVANSEIDGNTIYFRTP